MAKSVSFSQKLLLKKNSISVTASKGKENEVNLKLIVISQISIPFLVKPGFQR